MRVHRIHVRGDVDFDTSPKLRAELDPLVDDMSVETIVLDCRDMSFIDSSGLHVLLDAQQTLTDQGRRMRIENLSPALRRIFDLTGLTGVLRVQP